MKGLGETSPFHRFTNPRRVKSVYFWSWGSYLLYIYIFIAIALDETGVLVAVHFSIKTFTNHVIHTAPLGGATSTSSSSVLCLLTFAWHWSRIAMTLSAGVPPFGCSKTSVRYDLIINIQKTSPVGCWMLMEIWLIIKCKYKNWNHYFEVSSSDENSSNLKTLA